MSSKNGYRKAPFILIGLLAWFFIVKCSKNEFIWDMNNQNLFDVKTISKISGKTTLPQLLQCVENNSPEEIFEIIFDENSDLPDFIKKYLIKFKEYYEPAYNDLKSMDITYLINNMNSIKSYLEEQGVSESQAIQFSEVIPYYCIKNFEISRNGKSRKGAGRMYTICDNYLKNTATNHLTEKSAVIVCLLIRSYYRKEGIGKTDDYIEHVQEMITSYKEKYPSELGSNPIYKDEADYLERFAKLCDNIRNRHLRDKWDRLTFDDKISKLGE